MVVGSYSVLILVRFGFVGASAMGEGSVGCGGVVEVREVIFFIGKIPFYHKKIRSSLSPEKNQNI